MKKSLSLLLQLLLTTTTTVSVVLGFDTLMSRPVTDHCHLQCSGQRACQRVEGDHSTLAHMLQSGQLIDMCECPDGYEGLACNVPVPICGADGTCPDGSACEIGSSCDPCHYADAMSPVAGAMCRKPKTEYCAVDGSHFCTHGGKCSSNILTDGIIHNNDEDFSVHSHDTSNDPCKCLPEFTGPHCEFLKLPKLETNSAADAKSDDKKHHQATGFVAGVVCAMALLATLMILRQQRRRRRALVPPPDIVSEPYSDEPPQAVL